MALPSLKKTVTIGVGLTTLLLQPVLAEETSTSTSLEASSSSSSVVVSSSSSQTSSESSSLVESIETSSSPVEDLSSSNTVTESSSSEAVTETPASSSSTSPSEVTSSSSSSSTSSSSTATKVVIKTTLNAAKIRSRDFSSLAGTWKDGFGSVITITKEGNIYTKGANGGYFVIGDLTKNLPNNRLNFGLESKPAGDESSKASLEIVPAGQEFPSDSPEFKDGTDKNKDRLALLEAYKPGQEKAIFYRVTAETAETAPVTETGSTEATATETSATEATQTQSSTETSTTETSTTTVSSQATESSSSTASASTEVVIEEQAETTGLGTGGTATTRTRRVLPRTGDKTAIAWSITGLVSLLAGLLLTKKRRQS